MKTAKDFSTQKEYLAYLVATKVERIEMKRAARKFTDVFGINILQARAVKALNTAYKDDVNSGSIRRTIILNTYNWLDSHDDVHLDHVFADSIKDRQDNIWHLHDHQFQLTEKVGKPVSFTEKSIAWAELGVDKAGDTMALFMESDIKKAWNEKIFQMYLDGEINQHSVAMSYKHIDLAVNDPEWKPEYEIWRKVIDKIGNKEAAMKQGFFWAVSIADIYEGSCVLEGSNELTPTLPNNEAGKSVRNQQEPIIEKEESFYDRFYKNFNS